MMFSANDDVKEAIYILLGEREFTKDFKRNSKAGVALASSEYQVPPVLECIAKSQPDEMESYQSHGITIFEAPDHGIGFDDMDKAMFFWGMGMYTHYKVGDLTSKMWTDWDLGKNSFFLGMTKVAEPLSRAGLLEPFLKNVNIASEPRFCTGQTVILIAPHITSWHLCLIIEKVKSPART